MFCGVVLDNLVGIRAERMKRKMKVVRGIIAYAVAKWVVFTVAVQKIWDDLWRGHVSHIPLINMIFGCKPESAHSMADLQLAVNPAAPPAPVAVDEQAIVLPVDNDHDVQPSGGKGSTRSKHRAGKAHTAKKSKRKGTKGRDGRTPGFDSCNVKP